MEHAPLDHPLLVGLEQSALGAAMRQSLVLYPGAEVLHILGFALLVGSIVGFDLRVLGLSRHLPVAAFARHSVPLAMLGFAMALPTGLMLFSTEATSIAANPAFQFKLVCIFAGLANAALFHLGPWRRMRDWDSGIPAPRAARIGAGISLCAWIGAICGGRLIAYF
ncbi:hypothetical protein [Ferrovibrio sp.]|uniref:hypothetical protein n=1 Tax=Ferrovibrio sp. TaxID=1917215 RepID=UPI00311D3B0D